MILLSFLLLAALLLGGLYTLYARFWHRALSMTISFSAGEAFEGDRLVLREDVTNAKPLPLPMLTAKFRLSRSLRFDDEPEATVSDHYYRSDVFAVNVFQHIVRRQPFTCAARGVYRVDSMDLVSPGLLNNGVMVLQQKSAAVLTVFPKLCYLPETDIVYRQLMGEVEVRRFHSPDPFAFRGIREYLPGDDLRHLNHKAGAKTGQFMVNLYSPTAARQVLLLLNVEPYAAHSRDSILEGSIRLAASAAAGFINQGLTVGLVTNGRDVLGGGGLGLAAGGGQAHLHSLLTRCAHIDLTREAPPLAQQLAEDGLPAGPGGAQPYVLLVSAYTGQDMIEAFGRLLATGVAARWLVPVAEMPDGAPPCPNAEYWEL